MKKDTQRRIRWRITHKEEVDNEERHTKKKKKKGYYGTAKDLKKSRLQQNYYQT